MSARAICCCRTCPPVPRLRRLDFTYFTGTLRAGHKQVWGEKEGQTRSTCHTKGALQQPPPGAVEVLGFPLQARHQHSCSRAGIAWYRSNLLFQIPHTPFLLLPCRTSSTCTQPPQPSGPISEDAFAFNMKKNVKLSLKV